jgi:5-azacytidine-induced protein 1
MGHVEARVKALIARKDDAIVRLQQQLGSVLEQMRGTEAVLAAQQAELCE